MTKSTGKIFVIGRNKTGTTSIGKFLSASGFTLSHQRATELFIYEWANMNFHKIIKYCKDYDAFQDIPFSLDLTYQIMDYAYPGSKFILTERTDSKTWYNSLIRYQSKIIGKNRVPTANDLKEFGYRRKGWVWNAQKLIYGIDEETLYNKDIYTKHYESHSKRVREYFHNRPDDLLILNLENPDATRLLCEFLGLEMTTLKIPHLNKSRIPSKKAIASKPSQHRRQPSRRASLLGAIQSDAPDPTIP